MKGYAENIGIVDAHVNPIPGFVAPMNTTRGYNFGTNHIIFVHGRADIQVMLARLGKNRTAKEEENQNLGKYFTG